MKRFQPQKKDEGGTRNVQRVKRAHAAVQAYLKSKDESSDCLEADVTDLMADVCHLLHSEGFDPAELTETALMHWEEEA